MSKRAPRKDTCFPAIRIALQRPRLHIPPEWALLLWAVLTLLPGAATASQPGEFVVWDCGPQYGIVTPGGNMYWGNQVGNQSFADTVSFSADTAIIGYNFFTSPNALPPGGDLYQVSFYNDSAGLPGSLFAQYNVPAQSIVYVGNFPGEYDLRDDVYQVSLRFSPVQLSANTTYWVGASSLGFNIGQYCLSGAGDGILAQFEGDGTVHLTGTPGDQMFQLVAVPEPPGSALFMLAVALVWKRTLASASPLSRWRRSTPSPMQRFNE